MTATSLTEDRIREIIRELPALMGNELSSLSAEEVQRLLRDYFRVVEIAHYLRRGGVKAMLYRLETGKVGFIASDYFDEAHERLSATYRELYTASNAADTALVERLQNVSPEEEALVSRLLPELDRVLLLDKRLEAVSAEEE